MTNSVLVLASDAAIAHDASDQTVVVDPSEGPRADVGQHGRNLWYVSGLELLSTVRDRPWFRGWGLVVPGLDEVFEVTRYFAARFSEVLPLPVRAASLPADELIAALLAPNAKDLAISALVSHRWRALLLTLGDLSTTAIPLSTFRDRAGITPDLDCVTLTDYGQTIRLGEYEAAVDAVLYEHSPDFRRRARKRLRAADQSFGGSLRRARVQLGLRQSDFAPLSPREMGRIESGEVSSLHDSTRAVIERVMGMTLEEVADY